VNIARGTVVNEPALVSALVAGRLAGAALDVFADERPSGRAAYLTTWCCCRTHRDYPASDPRPREAMGDLAFANLRQS